MTHYSCAVLILDVPDRKERVQTEQMSAQIASLSILPVFWFLHPVSFLYFVSLSTVSSRISFCYTYTFSPILCTSVWYCSSSFNVVEFCNIADVILFLCWSLDLGNLGDSSNVKTTWMIRAVIGRKGRRSMWTWEELFYLFYLMIIFLFYSIQCFR